MNKFYFKIHKGQVYSGIYAYLYLYRDNGEVIKQTFYIPERYSSLFHDMCLYPIRHFRLSWIIPCAEYVYLVACTADDIDHINNAFPVDSGSFQILSKYYDLVCEMCETPSRALLYLNHNERYIRYFAKFVLLYDGPIEMIENTEL